MCGLTKNLHAHEIPAHNLAHSRFRPPWLLARRVDHFVQIPHGRLCDEYQHHSCRRFLHLCSPAQRVSRGNDRTTRHHFGGSVLPPTTDVGSNWQFDLPGLLAQRRSCHAPEQDMVVPLLVASSCLQHRVLSKLRSYEQVRWSARCLMCSSLSPRVSFTGNVGPLRF